MTKEEIKEYQKEYYEAHKEERKERMKSYYKTHKDKWKAHYQSQEKAKVWQQAHKSKYRAYQRAYLKNDTNSSGATKNSVRCRSRCYLFNTIKHSNLKGFEIHHCFGYENYNQFIYIPKELHLQIHQYLRDNGISADSNHFSQIVHLINDWDGYTYIKV